MNLKGITKMSEENLVAHGMWGKERSQRQIMFQTWVTGGFD